MTKHKTKYNLKTNKNAKLKVMSECKPTTAMHPLLSLNYSIVNCLRKLKPAMNLCIRLFVAIFFIRVGLIRVGDWEATVFLFEHEYKLPLLAPSAAACTVVILDLVVAPLLAIGFATRYAAILLLIMVSAMHFSYQTEVINYYHMLLLGMLAIYGGSRLSVDHLLRKRYCPQTMCSPGCR